MKLCIEDPKYVSRTLDYYHTAAAKVGSQGIDVAKQKKELLNMFMKVYRSLTKLLY